MKYYGVESEIFYFQFYINNERDQGQGILNK